MAISIWLLALELSILMFDLRTSSVSIRYHRGLICPLCQPVGLMGSLQLEKQALTWAAMSHPCVRIILEPQKQRSLVIVSASMPNIKLSLSSTRSGEVDQNLTSVWQIPICFWRYRMEVPLPDLSSQALASGWLHCPLLAFTSLPSQKWQCLGLIHIPLDLPLS